MRPWDPWDPFLCKLDSQTQKFGKKEKNRKRKKRKDFFSKKCQHWMEWPRARWSNSWNHWLMPRKVSSNRLIKACWNRYVITLESFTNKKRLTLTYVKTGRKKSVGNCKQFSFIVQSTFEWISCVWISDLPVVSKGVEGVSGHRRRHGMENCSKGTRDKS